MMKRTSILTLTLVFAGGAAADAATCPDLTPAPIIAASAAAAKCQKAISGAATGLVKAAVKTRGKCVSKGVPANCPNAKDDGKVLKAATKGSGKIAKACASDAELGGLGTSYSVGSAGSVDAAVVASCVLSQTSVESEIVVGNSYGVATDWFSSSKDRDKCAGDLGKSASKLVPGALKAINKCVDGQIKLGTGGDLAPICVGSFSGGAFVPPSDAKAAAAIAKLFTKAEAGIDKKCGAVSTAQIESIFACPGATTVDDLKNCIVCDNYASVTAMAAAQYSEAGTFVANAPAAIQTAVDAAATGAKLLIGSGVYEEEILIPTPTCGALSPSPGDPCTTDADCGGVPLSCEASVADGLQLVGCGAATNDRPDIVPPSVGGPFLDGIFASGTDGLLFQSLDIDSWPDDGIFVTDAQGVSFRDAGGDGDLTSIYTVFPVRSDNVLVEASEVTQVIDAAIYVGQSSNIVVRYNTVTDSVAGIEIENSATADVHNNTATRNTGGILVFKLPGPPVQDGQDHKIHHNSVFDNNTESEGIAIPGTIVATIPTGTGMLSFSNDTSDYHHNRITDNGSFGFAMLDQEAIDGLTGGSAFGGVYSADQKTENNDIRTNQMGGNGNSPDTTGPNATPLASNLILVLGDEAGHGNCFAGNSASTSIFLTANDCP